MSWDDTLPWFQAQLIAYNQIREIEEQRWDAALAGVKLNAQVHG